jgi:flagellar hook-associated protein 1 FlgK
MSLLGILNTGSIGVNASQQGVQVAATNLSNVATEGYTRRQASIRPETGISESGNARRMMDSFVERRLLSARSASGEASAESLALGSLDAVFAEGEGGLGSSIDQFQASLTELSSRPNDMAVREQVLARAGNVASSFQNAAAGLDQARADSNQRITGAVDEVNQRLRQIAGLTGQIAKSEITGVEASDLRDRRDVLVREVAERVPVTTVESDNGSQFSLLLGGSQTLVAPDGKLSELKATSNNGSDVRVTKMAAGQEVDITNMLNSGSIGGQIKARDGALKQITQKLDQLAYDFQQQYNQVHEGGVALDGSTGNSLFEPLTSVSGAASQITLSADIIGQPELLAASMDAAALPSDNRNAISLSNLSSTGFALGGMTVTEALASLTGAAGMAVQNASHGESFASGALEQVEALRENSSAVSSDEEMVSMMKYQRAYEASLQVIQVADQMMGELMNLRR